jgi:murein DD-endopeptidase MepM/ murein hydrolase activator NlpD
MKLQFLGAALSLGWIASTNATIINQSYNVVASRLFNNNTNVEIPNATFSGNFTVNYNDSVDVRSGTLRSMNFTLDGKNYNTTNTGFDYISRSGYLILGGRLNGVQSVSPGTDDFFLVFGSTLPNINSGANMAFTTSGVSQMDSTSVYGFRNINISYGTSPTPPPNLPPVTPPPPISYDLPLKMFASSSSTNVFKLVTEAGGPSTDCTGGCFDSIHTADGYFSLDISAKEDVDVVAGAAGRVVQVLPNISDQKGFGPVVVIYNGNGYYSKYQEFSANPTVAVGQFVEKGEKIGNYIVGQTGDTGSRALHFQVKYDESYREPCATESSCPSVSNIRLTAALEPGFSPNIPEIANVTLNGQRLGSYKLFNPIPRTVTSGAVILSTPSFDQFSTFNGTTANSTVMLVERSPAYAWNDMLVPLGAEYISFDYNWIELGDGDYLTVFLGDNLLFTSIGIDSLGLNQISSGFLSIKDLTGQNLQLLFFLNSVGRPNAQLEISNLNFSKLTSVTDVPEPTSWLMFGFSLVILSAITSRRSATEHLRGRNAAQLRLL